MQILSFLFLGASLAGLSLAKCTAATRGITGARLSKMKAAYKNAALVPGVLADAWDPVVDVKYAYGGKNRPFGYNTTTIQTTMPVEVTFNAEPGYLASTTNYTLVMADPDAASPNVPVLQWFLHQMTFNVHPSCAANAEDDAEDYAMYQPPTPPSIESHRYLFLIYRQPAGEFTVPPDPLAQQGRAGFDLPGFVERHKLTLVGGSYMLQGIGNDIGA